MTINIFLRKRSRVLNPTSSIQNRPPGDTATHLCQTTAHQELIMFSCKGGRQASPCVTFFNGFRATFLNLAPRLLGRFAWNPYRSPCVWMPVVSLNLLKNIGFGGAASIFWNPDWTKAGAAGGEISPCGENLDNQILPYGKRYRKPV